MGAITPEMCVDIRELGEPRLSRDGTLIVYATVERTGDQRVARLLVRSLVGDTPDVIVATEPAVRPGRGSGGGAWCFTADEAAVVYVGAEGDLWLQSLAGGRSRQLTTYGSEHSVSSPCCAPGVVVYELDQAEIHQLALDSLVDRRLDDGTADFCLDPFIDPLGRAVRWLAWNVPDMPWDRSRVQRRVSADDGDDHVVDLLVRGSVQQARELPDGRSICVRDDDGWSNVWVAGWPEVVEPFEHAGATWGPGQRSYAWSPDGTRIVFTRNVRGFGQLCVTELASNTTPMVVAHGVHGQLSWQGDRVAALRSDATTPPAVVVYDAITWQRTVVAEASTQWASADLVEPEAVAIATGSDVVHARLYRGTGRGLIIWLHGGPTDQWMAAFMPRIAYWRAQGWTIVVPDHRGSSGHGRAYQQALRGQWGVLDVQDVVAVTEHAHTHGWGSAQNTVVMGGSAGGFTALGAIAARPDDFAAGVVLYPVTDLIDLAERSHRFEQHYTHHLVGPLPAALDDYRQRSPIAFADRVAKPILIMHGDADPVVPVEQSVAFAERVRGAHGEVELHVYEGEGHGFRLRPNQLDEYQRIAAFLARHVPLASAQ